MTSRFSATLSDELIQAMDNACEIVMDYLQGKITREKALANSDAKLVIEWLES